MPALPADRRKALLAALRTGLSREAACAKLGIRARDIDATGKRYAEQVAEAEAAGDALIEATLLERGMAGDTQALKMALERRPRPADSDLGTDLATLTPAERDAVRAMVEEARLNVRVVRVSADGAPLAPARAPQSAARAAGHLDAGQAPVAAPGAPQPPAESVYACGLPMLPGEPDCPHCHGPDRSAERPRGPVVAPHDWMN